MDETQFVKKLKTNNRTYNYFIERKTDADFAPIKNIFEPVKNKTQSKFDDPLLKLIDMYDFSPSYLTNLGLNEAIEYQFGQYGIGSLEGDFVLMNKVTNSIYVVNYYNPKEIVYQCAKNGGSFLDALYIRLSSGIPESDDDIEIQAFRRELSDKCAMVAGGKEFREFWTEV